MYLYNHVLNGGAYGKTCLCFVFWSLGYTLERAPKRVHGSQSDNSRCPCAVVFASPLTSRLCSQLQELQELPTSPLRMRSSSERASAPTYLGSWTGSWTRVQGARSWCCTTELSTHPSYPQTLNSDTPTLTCLMSDQNIPVCLKFRKTIFKKVVKWMYPSIHQTSVLYHCSSFAFLISPALYAKGQFLALWHWPLF